MTEMQSWVGPTIDGLADVLADAPADTWDAPSLCPDWQVRHVVAHVTMPAGLTPEQYGAGMAAAHGDSTVLSNTVAARDASLPAGDLWTSCGRRCCTPGSHRAAGQSAHSATPSSTHST